MTETTFYDDNNLCVKKMKTNMTLDLSKSRNQKLAVPTSDIGLFITTPELERLITQNNSNYVLTTPTPTTNILFPKNVTEEQEAYARGFVDALGKLHKNNAPAVATPSTYTALGIYASTPTALDAYNPTISQTTSFVTNNNFQQTSLPFPTDTNAKTINTSTVSSLLNHNNMISQNYDSNFFNQPNIYQTALPSNEVANNYNNILNTGTSMPSNMQYQMIKSESYHTVPHSPASVSSQSSSQVSPLDLQSSSSNFSPINMEDQELAKIERKRARNRVAATKCRNRKLERITRLEYRVKELKDQNNKLEQSSSLLREQVKNLKSTIIHHTNQGCQVMLTSKFLDSNLDFS